MIRKAGIEDWNIISSISARAGYDDYINNYSGISYLNAGNVYVHAAKEIDGFIKLDPLADGSLWFSGLRVDPDSRRNHVAIDLINYASGLTINSRCLSLRCMVESSNVPSRNLMESSGLSVVEKYFFFQGGIDISNYKTIANYSGNYVNKEWKFDSRGEFFYSRGNNKVYVHSGRLLYHTALAGDQFDYNGEGTTCAPENIARFIKVTSSPG